MATFAFLLPLAGCGDGTSPDNNQPGITPPANHSPVVKIDAPEGEVMELSTVTLSAAKSTDPDGDGLTFSWKQVSGIEVELSNADTAEVSFKLPKLRNTEKLEFEVKVTDDNDRSMSKRVEMTAREANGVLYTAVQDTPNVEKLYFDHPAFDEPLVLDAIELAEGQHVEYGTILVTPDHRYAIFEREVAQGDDVSRRVLRAALDGSGVADITGAAVARSSYYSSLKLSPDGAWVAFKGRLDKDATELFAVPTDSADGSDLINLSGEITAVDVNGLVAGNVGYDFFWSPDGREILFSGDLRTDRHYEIFVTNLETGERRVISREPSEDNAEAFSYTHSNNGPYAWSPDGEYVAMMQENVHNRFAIDVVRADGTGRVTVADNLDRDIDFHAKIAMRWSSQGALAFRGNTNPPGGENSARELYIYTPGIANPGPFAVAGTSAMDDEGADGIPDGQVGYPSWSPDGERLAFWTRRINPSRVANFIVPADATSDAAKLRIDEGNDAAGGFVTFWLHDENGILLKRNPDGPLHIYLNALDGTPLRQLSAGIDAIAPSVWQFVVSEDSRLLAYSGFPSGVSEVHVVSIQGGALPRTVSGPITASDGDDSNGAIDGDAFIESFSPDGSMLLFSGDLETDQLDELYAVPADSMDGSERRRITELLADDSDENGRPDGYFGYATWVGPDPQ
ncbi:MAG TPA: hypothetical protein VF254_07165 [Gammaproteobacteria bacterium]